MKLHLPKGLRAALLACLALASVGVTKADSSIISINFATGDDVNVKTDAPGSVGGVSASGWMNILGNSASAISKTYTALTDQSGAAVPGGILLKTPQNPWSPNGLPYTTLSDQIQRSYLDLQPNIKWNVNFYNTGDSYGKVDVILYFSGDGGEFAPVSVNGKSYIGGVGEAATSDTQGWGNRTMSSSGSSYGDNTINVNNTIKVTGLYGPITLSNVPQSTNAKRATLAGMQIILSGDGSEVFYTADLTSKTSEEASALTWTRNNASTALKDIAESDRFLNLTNGNSTTITFAGQNVRVIQASSGTYTLGGALSAETLFAKSGTEMVVQAAVSDGSSLNVGGLGTVKFVGNRTFTDLTVYGGGTKSIKDTVSVTGEFGVLAAKVVLEEEGSLNAGSLSVSSGSSIDLEKNATLKADALSLGAGSSIGLKSGATFDLSERPFERLWDESVLASVSGDGLLKLQLGNGNANDNELITSNTTSAININTNVTFVGPGELSLVGELKDAHTLNINAGKSLTFEDETGQTTHGALRVKRSTLNVNGSLNAYYIQLGHETAGNHPGVINLYEGGSLKATEIEFCNAGSGNDSVFMMSGGVLEFTQGDSSAFSYTVSKTGDVAKGIVKLHGGTLKADSSSWFIDTTKTVEIDGVTVEKATDKTVEIGGVTVETAEGKTITLRNATLVGNISTSGNLVLDGTFSGSGSLSVLNSGTARGNLTVNGSAEITEMESAGTLALTGSSNVSGVSRVSVSAGGSLTTSGTLTLKNNAVLEAAGTMTLGGTVKVADNGACKLSVGAGGSMTVQCALDLGATIENAGTFTLAEGGSLSFTSKDDLTENDTSYADEKRSDSGNGYLQGSFSIVDGAQGSKASGITSVTVGGVTFSSPEPDAVVDKDKDSFLATDGSNVNIVGSDAQKGLFYIRFNENGTGTDGYTVYTTEADADNSAGYATTTGLVLDKANTGDTLKLVMKTGLHENAEKGIIMRSDATIQLETGVSLNKVTIETDGTADIPRLTLTGTGTYVMDKATKLDVDQTTFAAWTGSVAVTDTELGGKGDGRISITDLDSLAKHSADPLVISGLSGYACDVTVTTDATNGKEITTVSKNPEVTYNLNLTDIAADENTPAVAALTLTDAQDETLTGGTLTLNGKLSGEGSIVNNSTGHVSLGGNISEWKGSYTASEASSMLTLAADAKLNASVTGGSVTLEGALTLGKTMSLTGNLTGAGSITLKGDTLDAAKTAITVAGSVTGSGALAFTIEKDSLSFLSGLADGGEFVLLSAKGGITGYSGATLNNATVIDDDKVKVRYYVETSQNAVTLSKVTLGLQWKGDVWTKTKGFGQTEDSPLTTESVVSFTGGGPSKVEVDDAQVVKSINVDAYGSEYTFTGDSITTDTLGIVHGNLVVQNNLTVNVLTSIHTGTILTVSEGGSLTGGGMSNNGTLSIGKDSVVTVNTLTGDGAVSGDGKLVVKSGSVSASTLGSNTGTIEMNSLNDSDATTVGGTLLVRQNGSYTGAYKEKTSIGTTDASATQALRADANLTVIGDAGTVSLTRLDNTVAAENKLGGINTKGETVLLNNVRDDAAADGTTTKVPTTVTLGSASRMEKGVLDFTVSAAAVNDSLTSADKPVVTTGAALSLKEVTLKVHEVQNKDLGITTGGQEKDIVLFVVNDTPNDCKVDNVNVNMDDCPWMTKYFTNFRVVEGSVNVIGDANTSYYSVHGQTPNGTAGLALAGKAMFHLDPQTQNPDGELAQVLDMLDTHLEAGNKGAMDKLGAALAGSSLSAVGLALADDVQRQLRSIRNRTTTMGVNECVVNEDMPYVNGWISGDGNYRQLSESGTDAGYQLSSWGGTVGVDVDVNPNLTLGVAVSALFGDYTGKAADTLTGDLDTQYVSLFARVSTGSWVNTFVGTLGRADVDLERTIPGVTGKTTYKTDGMMFGFLYEVARTFALNEDASTCVQPLFNMSFSHTSLDSATEGGTADTRLTTDSASLTQFSLGLGGRLQSVVGENEYNRASIFEARALLKLDLGDRYSRLNTALAALPTATVTTRSNEKGVIGAEVGASLTIPISQDAGSIFFDVNADFNADQTGVNGSVGYRINF